jgi:hypothetical protein
VPYPIAYGQETLESKIEVRTKSLAADTEDVVSVNGLTKEGRLSREVVAGKEFLSQLFVSRILVVDWCGGGWTSQP